VKRTLAAGFGRLPRMNRIWSVVLVLAVGLWLLAMVARLGAVYVFGFIGLAFALRYFFPSLK